MTIAVGIYVFDDVEVLDFAGPYEVFTTAARVALRDSSDATAPFAVFTVARAPGAVRARAGLVIQPDHRIDQHPPIDLLVIPGGVVTAELEQPAVPAWITQVAQQARVVASVCTGAFLLAKAGLLAGRQVTTHWEDLAMLREMFPGLGVRDGVRWVDEGSIVTSAGIAAGMDMSLHLVERLASRELAQRTARQMDIDWRE
jgi:transcriptional regulator GlxA family with amidase domain